MFDNHTHNGDRGVGRTFLNFNTKKGGGVEILFFYGYFWGGLFPNIDLSRKIAFLVRKVGGRWVVSPVRISRGVKYSRAPDLTRPVVTSDQTMEMWNVADRSVLYLANGRRCHMMCRVEPTGLLACP